MPAPRLFAGRLIDGYEVIRELGEGGMGAVFLVRDVKLGRKAVLKVIRSEAQLAPDRVARFLFEARVTASFSHPHIVTVYGVGEIDGCPYVAMEYLRGQSLRQRMGREPFALGEVLRLGQVVAEALAEAQRHGVLHRDLKPENIFLTRDGRPRVLDFGLAKRVARPRPPSAEDTGEAWPAPVDDSRRAPSDLSVTGEALDGSTPDPPRPAPPRHRTRGMAGTPCYMAPEQWQQLPLTPAVDVWALGLILFEMLTGRLPHEEESWPQLALKISSPEPVPRVDEEAPGVPRPVADLIARCLQKDPLLRPSAAELAEELGQLAGGGRHAVSLVDPRLQGPFRGLLPFRPEDADLFFGRDGETATLLEKLGSQALLPVVGASGVGKTSLVMAGLVPALERRGGWRIFVTRPGEQPFRNLASSLLHPTRETLAQASGSRTERADSLSPAVAAFVGEGAASLSGSLAASPALLGGLLRAEARAAASPSTERALSGLGADASLPGRGARGEVGRVLLIVDQFEELYTQNADFSMRRSYIEALTLAADDPEGPVRVVLAARDDFLGRMAAHPGMAAALDAGLLVLRTPSPEVLAETLLRPLEALGYAFEDSLLVSDMIAEVEAEAASLPLLQFAAQRLWELQDRGRRLLLRAAYRQMGGVEGALADHADRVLEDLGPNRQPLARTLLLRLVSAEGTRRMVPRRQLIAGLTGPGGPGDPALVLDRLLDARLVVGRRARPGDGRGPSDAAEGDLLVELAHESLLTRWRRLRAWRAEEREDLVYRERVGAAAGQWARNGRSPGLLWSGAELQQAVAWRSLHHGPLAPLEEEFVGALQQKQASGRRLVLLALVVIVVTALLIAAGSLEAVRRVRVAREAALQLASEARSAEGKARDHLAAALYEKGVDARADGDALAAELLLASAVAQNDHPAARGLLNLIRRRPDRPVLRWQADHGEPTLDLAFSPDGATLLSAGQGAAIRRWEATTGQPRTPLGGHGQRVTAVAASADGRFFASGDQAGELRLWDAASGAPRGTLPGSRERITALGFSPDGQLLAAGGDEGVIRVWEVAGLRLVATLAGHAQGVRSLVFQPGGNLLASGGVDRRLLLWDLTRETPLREIVGLEGRVYDLAFSPDGLTLAVAASPDVRRWDLSALPDGPLTEKPRLVGHARWACGLAYTPDGGLLASGSWDRTVRLWDALSGQEIARLVGFAEPVCALAAAPDGRGLAVGGGDHTLRLWDLERGRPAEALPDLEAAQAISALALASDGGLLATGGLEPTIRLWDPVRGEPRGALALPDAQAVAPLPVAPGPASAGHKTVSAPGAISLFTDRQEVTLEPGGAWVSGIAFSPDGRLLAAVGGRGAVFWDIAARRELVDARLPDLPVWSLAFAPDGAVLLGGQGESLLYDPRRRRELLHLEGPPGWAWASAVSADGRLLAVAGEHGQIALWERDSGERRFELLRQEGGAIRALAFSPDGQSLVSGGDDHRLTLWDLQTGEVRTRFSGSTQGIEALALSGDGHWLASGHADGGLHLWDLSAEGIERVTLPAQTGPLTRLTFSADGSRLVSAGWDGRVHQWSVPALLQPVQRLQDRVRRETGLVLDGLQVQLGQAEPEFLEP